MDNKFTKQVAIYTTEGQNTDALTTEWYGRELTPPVRYRLTLLPQGLRFEAERGVKPALNPNARPGEFCGELWRYDVAEFFVATPGAERYMEVNLSPNGAWWGCVFTAPRVADAEAGRSLRVEYARGEVSEQGWKASLLIPREVFDALGMTPETCRFAVCAVQDAPDYLYLTTADDCSGEPDFHRPYAWKTAVLTES